MFRQEQPAFGRGHPTALPARGRESSEQLPNVGNTGDSFHSVQQETPCECSALVRSAIEEQQYKKLSFLFVMFSLNRKKIYSVLKTLNISTY